MTHERHQPAVCCRTHAMAGDDQSIPDASFVIVDAIERDRALTQIHEAADAVWPHQDFVDDCHICRLVAELGRVPAAATVRVQVVGGGAAPLAQIVQARTDSVDILERVLEAWDAGIASDNILTPDLIHRARVVVQRAQR